MGWSVWPPYQYAVNDKVTGIDIKVVKFVAKELGCTLELVKMPWQGIIDSIKTGDIDLTAGASDTKERRSYGYFSRPYRREEISLFIQKKNQQKFQQVKKLTDTLSHNFRLGISDKNYYGQEFEFLKKNKRFLKSLVHINGTFTFTEFAEQDIDAILADRYSGLHRIRLNGLSADIGRVDGFSIYTGPVHLFFSRKTSSDDKIRKVNQAITKYLQRE